jgi:hypothetical protein
MMFISFARYTFHKNDAIFVLDGPSKMIVWKFDRRKIVPVNVRCVRTNIITCTKYVVRVLRTLLVTNLTQIN